MAKRMSKGAFWLEVLVALLVGGGTFWGVKALRDEGLLMGQELLHHDFLHLQQENGYGTNHVTTHTNIVIIGADERDIQRFGWPLEDDMVSKILEKIASHEPAGIALDLYRDMPVPKRGDLVHHLNNTLTNHPNIIGISQIDLEEPDLTIKAPLVLRDKPTRVGENSFANDDDRMLRRGMLYFYSDAGIHPSLGLLMTAQYLGKNWGELITLAPGPILKLPMAIADLTLTNGQPISVAAVSRTTRNGESETDVTGVLKITASDNPLQYDEEGNEIASTNIVEISDSGGITDLNGDIQTLKVTASDGAITIDTIVAGTALPPADWFPERADTEYEFRWLFDIDNDASTGLKVDGVSGLGADIVAEIRFDSGKGIETGHAYRPALNAGETNSVVIPELYFGSVQEGM